MPQQNTNSGRKVRKPITTFVEPSDLALLRDEATKAPGGISGLMKRLLEPTLIKLRERRDAA